MGAYYNEHDTFAAAWLRELIKDGLIASGEVDERSIEDVTPDDIRSFRQCHFFAGVGVWSLAARRAGFDDDAPLWTGSCPCQPFSTAGKGGGFADERHLWPAFHYLIEQCRPPLVAGEQVAGADGDAWLNLVSADLDATGYAFGAAETCAAGFGAPHIRSRNYWVARRLAYADQQRQSGSWFMGRSGHSAASGDREINRVVDVGGHSRLADTIDDGQRQHGHGVGGQTGAREGEVPGGAQRLRADPANGGAVGGVADTARGGRREERPNIGGFIIRNQPKGRSTGPLDGSDPSRPGPTNGLWRDADWILCRDEPVPKWRPVGPGSFPLADAGTVRNRVGLLRGAGNAVTLGQAEGFLRAVAETAWVPA